MAFAGSQNRGFDPLQLAFALMDRKRQAQADEQKAMFDRVKAAQDAQKFALDQRKLQLENLTKQADLAKKINELSGGVAEAQRNAESEFTPSDLSVPGSAADSQAFTNIVAGADPSGVSRAVNAQSLLNDRVGQVARIRAGLGGSPDPVGSTLGAADASVREEGRQRRRQREDFASQQRTTAEIAEEFRLRKETDDRRRDADPTRWTTPQLESYRKKVSDSREFKLVSKMGQQRELLKRYDPNDPQQVFGVLQAVQRNNDEGATVRQEDVNIMMSFGASSIEALTARMLGVFEAEGRLPDGFGESMGRMLEGQLGDMDVILSNAAAEIENDAERYGWTKAQQDRATPRALAIKRARKRLEERSEAAAMGVPEVDDPALGDANTRAAEFLGIPPEEVTADQAAAMWMLMSGGGNGNP